GGRWPRSAERRHFRGNACTWAVDKMSQLWPEPEEQWRSLRGLGSEVDVIGRVTRKWPMHGAWAGFKVADLAERVTGYPVEFSRNTGLLYESPRAAVVELATHTNRTPGELYEDQLAWISDFSAPPRRDRPCGPQELEMV